MILVSCENDLSDAREEAYSVTPFLPLQSTNVKFDPWQNTVS